MVTIKFTKKDNEVSMTRMPVEDDLIERNAQNRFWLSSKRKLQGITSVIITVVIIVGFSVIKHKRSITSQYDNERYHYFFISLITHAFRCRSSLFRNTSTTTGNINSSTERDPSNLRRNIFLCIQWHHTGHPNSDEKNSLGF